MLRQDVRSSVKRRKDRKVKIPVKASVACSMTVSKHPLNGQSSEIKQRYYNILHSAVKKTKLRSAYATAYLKFLRNSLGVEEKCENCTAKLKDSQKVAVFFDFMAACGFKRKYLTIDNFYIIFEKVKIGGKMLDLVKRLYTDDYTETAWEKLIAKCEYPEWLEMMMSNYEFVGTPPCRLLVTATMSAGKSTFINAIAGRKIASTKNLACTGRLHQIYSKPFDDGYTCKWDRTLYFDGMKKMIADNEESSTGTSFESVFFNGKLASRSFVIFDTPGVNASGYSSHRSVAEEHIGSHDYDAVLFLLNYENMGTDDERDHLSFIRDNKPEDVPVIFIINKIDSRKNEDPLPEKIMADTMEYLRNEGFKSPEVYLLSARTAYLAKASKLDGQLNEDDEEELDILSHKFRRKLDISAVYEKMELPYTDIGNENRDKLEYRCGIGWLEDCILKLIENNERNVK